MVQTKTVLALSDVRPLLVNILLNPRDIESGKKERKEAFNMEITVAMIRNSDSCTDWKGESSVGTPVEFIQFKAIYLTKLESKEESKLS